MMYLLVRKPAQSLCLDQDWEWEISFCQEKGKTVFPLDSEKMSSWLELTHREKSSYYRIVSNGNERVFEPSKVISEENMPDHKIIGDPLTMFNLFNGPSDSEIKALTSIEISLIEKISELKIAAVASNEYYDVSAQQIDEALKNHVGWSSIINVGDLIEVKVPLGPPLRPSKELMIYFKVMMLINADRRPIKFGYFDRDTVNLVLLSNPVGSLYPPQEDKINPVCNEEQRESLKNILEENLKHKGLKSILILGPCGSGKRTALRSICRKLGLPLLKGSGATFKEYTENITYLSRLAPCCLMIRECDFEKIHEHLRRSHHPNNSVTLAVMSDSFERNLSLKFHHSVKFGHATDNDKIVLLSSSVKKDFLNECIRLTRGFTIADIIQLTDLLSLKKDGKSVEMITQLTKQIRSGKSGSGQIPQVSWEQVAGLEEAKNFIRETLEIPQKYGSCLNKSLGRRHGILLYGPPGTGKTLLAKAVATEYAWTFLPVKGPELLSMYIGETESNIRSLFSTAKSLQPCILFFDELDSLATARGQDGDSAGVSDRIVAQLIVEMDKLECSEDTQVFIIGATNRPDMLDKALLRPGRLDKSIYLGAPSTKAEQVAVLRASSCNLNLSADVDMEKLADLLNPCYSPADLANICTRAMRQALRRKIEEIEASGCPMDDLIVQVVQYDFEQAIGQVSPSITHDAYKI